MYYKRDPHLWECPECNMHILIAALNQFCKPPLSFWVIIASKTAIDVVHSEVSKMNGSGIMKLH